MKRGRASLGERMMDLALEAARRGRTAPNPHVGAVIAHGEEVVGVGHHERAGEAHAEVNALRAAGERAKGATLYCTLEPCNHHGRTPPCVDAILEAGIAKVVIGCIDPAKHGPTSGVPRLRAAGVEVEVGVREEASREIVEDFACLVTKKRPLVVLKAAVTLDGRIASRTGDSKWITGEAARREAHRLRDRADAVMVGVGTVLADDPRLDVRMVEGRDPIRVVLDTHLRTPRDAKLVAHGSSRPTWIFHSADAPRERRDALMREGVELIETAVDAKGALDLEKVLRELGRRDVMRLLVEGGARVHGALLDRELADRAEVFVAPLVLGDPEARPLAEMTSPATQIANAFRLDGIEMRRFGRDVRIRGRIVRGANPPEPQEA